MHPQLDLLAEEDQEQKPSKKLVQEAEDGKYKDEEYKECLLQPFKVIDTQRFLYQLLLDARLPNIADQPHTAVTSSD